MSSSILQRILTESGYPDLLSLLSGQLSGTDFASLLLEVFHRRANRISPSDLMRAYRENRFVQPSPVPYEEILALDQLASRLRGKMDWIELSPLAPLGVCSALGPVHQNKIVSALRQTEVVSDPTNLMALEVARRRRQDRKSGPIRLISSHRVTRAQHFDQPGFSAHFRLLCLCTGDRDGGSLHFELDNLQQHLSFYLRFLTESQQLGYKPGRPQLRFLDYTGGKMQEGFIHRILPFLNDQHPELNISFDEKAESGRGFYRSFRFQIGLNTADGNLLPLIDGGDTDWTQQLLSDRKERLLTSAMGTQMYALLFK